MKSTYKKITILLAALALILMPSCSNEEGFENIPSTSPDREGVITFRIQGKRQAVSYAIATENENTVDSLEIYMFSDDSKKLQKVFRIGKTDLSQTGADLTATINVTGRTGKHIFYFVANARGNASSLANTDAGATTEEDFRERLTDVQNGLLATPLLMTAHQVIADVATPTDDEKRVKLLRRVARFDIENDASDTNFTIGNILIEKAKQQGYAFGNATGTPTQTLATGNLPKIENNEPADFNTGTPVESAFYLYPTTLGEGKTEISFEGDFMGERRIYSLNSNMNIEANKRYVLKVKRIAANMPEFTIEAVDWNDGGTHEAQQEADDMIVGTVTLTGATGTQETDKTYDITNATDAGTITIPVTTYNQAGTRAEVTFLMGNLTHFENFEVKSTQPVLTYRAGYEQTHTIIIPKQTKNRELNIVVEIINETRPEQRYTIRIVRTLPNYPGTDLKPIVCKGVLWAPLNVGATEIGSTTDVKHTGLLFQWGRNVGLVYGTTKVQAGPVTYEQGTTGEYKDMFIKSGEPFHWCSDRKDGLWSGDNRRGPCPEGWRVPTVRECVDLLGHSSNAYDHNDEISWNVEENRFEVKGDNPEETLYFPTTGSCMHTFVWHNQSTYGNYWTSSVTTMAVSKSSAYVSGDMRTAAFAMRCVQD